MICSPCLLAAKLRLLSPLLPVLQVSYLQLKVHVQLRSARQALASLCPPAFFTTVSPGALLPAAACTAPPDTIAATMSSTCCTRLRWSLQVRPASCSSRCRMQAATHVPTSISTSCWMVHWVLRFRCVYFSMPKPRSSGLLVLAARSRMDSRPHHAQCSASAAQRCILATTWGNGAKVV